MIKICAECSEKIFIQPKVKWAYKLLSNYLKEDGKWSNKYNYFCSNSCEKKYRERNNLDYKVLLK